MGMFVESGSDILRKTVQEVETAELEAILTLCRIIDNTRSPLLLRVCSVMKEWTRCPPSEIRKRLEQIEAEIDSNDERS